MKFSGPEYVNVNGQTRIRLTVSGSNGIMDQYFKGYYSTDNGSTWVSFIRRPDDGYYSGGTETRSFILEDFPDVIRKFPNTKTIKIKFEHHGDTPFVGWRQLDSKTKDVDLVANDITRPELSMKVTGTPLSNSYNMIDITSLTPTFTPTTKLGASVKSYSFTVEGKSYTTAPYTSAVLTQGGWQTVTGTVTDSRGFTASVSERIWVMANMPSLDVTGGYLNEAISCYITPANKDAYSRLVLSRKVGSSYEDIMTVDVNTLSSNATKAVTITGNDLTGTYEKFPNTVNVPVRVRLLTYTDAYATQIEENTKDITLKIPDNADTKPSITNIATVGSPTLLNQSELYVKGKNGVKPTVTAGGKYNASIAKITWTVDGKTYDHGKASDALTSFGTLPIVVTATDTRGFSNSATKNISVSDYTKPLLSAADGKSKIIIDRSADGDSDLFTLRPK
jgi:hypothetical protein